MKVVIFGASGSVGKHLVQQALNKGHQVDAFCRNIDKLDTFEHKSLNKIKGDVFHLKEVEKAVKGKDAILVVLGSGKSRKSTVRSVGTQNIIQAMQKQGVRRLICQSTLGAGDSQGNLNFFWKYIMFGWLLKPVFLDHERQEYYVTKSHLDWTIVRPAAFTDGSRTSKYQHGFSPTNRSLQLKISRADVSDFILQQLESKNYLLQTPGLSY